MWTGPHPSNIPSFWSVDGACDAPCQLATFYFSLIGRETLASTMADIKKSFEFKIDEIYSYFLKIGIPIVAPTICEVLNLFLSMAPFKTIGK